MLKWFSKKKEQDVLLEKEKALKDEENLVTQLAAANKNLGNSGDEKKNKKALAEVAAAGVKAAEAQLLEVKAKVKKANEMLAVNLPKYLLKKILISLHIV